MRRLKLQKMNKKGSDFPSIIFAIAIIFAVGVMLVVMSYLALQIYENLNDTLESQPDLAGGEANDTLVKVIGFERSMWDYFFVAIVAAYVLSMIFLAFVTPSNPWVFAIFTILGSIGLFVGVALSNAWEKFAEADVLSETIARFPITDMILNNFYPLLVTLVLVLVMVMLFGKRFIGGESSGGGIR